MVTHLQRRKYKWSIPAALLIIFAENVSTLCPPTQCEFTNSRVPVEQKILDKLHVFRRELKNILQPDWVKMNKNNLSSSIPMDLIDSAHAGKAGVALQCAHEGL